MANGRGRGRRMDKEWNSIPAFDQALTAAAIFGPANVSPNTSATVIRMLGEYTIGNTAATTAGDAAIVAVGIGVVSAEAFAVAAGAGMPNPGGEPEYPWLYWASHTLSYPKALSGTISGDSELPVIRRAFDIKSMRKMKPGQVLAFILQYIDITGAPPLTFRASHTRVLFAGV